MADHRLQIVLSGKDASQKAFRSVQQRMKGFTKSVFNMRTAMAGAAGAAGIGYMIDRSLEATRELEKLEKQTGFSTTAIQELQFAAREAGVRNERLYDALGEISQRMGEASADFRRTGGDVTEMGEGFEAAGMAMEGLDERNPQQVLYEVADAIREAETESQALNIAVKTFGDEGGRDMVAMLREGSDGLLDMAERANELGLVLDRDVIKQSADAKERIDLLVDVLGTQFQRVVGELAPEISKTADNMADWVAANEDFLTQDIPKGLKEFGSVASDVAGFLSDMASNARKAYIVMQALTGMDPAGIMEIFEDTEEADKRLKKMQDYDLQAGIEGLSDVDRLTDKSKEAKHSTEELTTAIKILNREMTVDGTPTIAPKFDKPDDLPGTLMPGTNGELRRAADIYEQTRTPVENLRTEVAELNELANRGLIDHQTYVRALDEAYGKLGDTAKDDLDVAIEILNRGLDDTREGFNYMEEFSKMTARNMQRNFSNLFYDAFTGQLDSADDYFESFAKSLLRTWADVEAQMMASKLFGEAFMAGDSSSMGGVVGGVGGWIADLFHDGGVVGKDGKPVLASPGMFNNAPRLHNGLMPDEYPAILQKGEAVIPKNGMQAPNMQVNVIDNTSEKKDVSKQEPKWDGEKWVMNVVLDAANRNKGGFRNGMKAALNK